MHAGSRCRWVGHQSFVASVFEGSGVAGSAFAGSAIGGLGFGRSGLAQAVSFSSQAGWGSCRFGPPHAASNSASAMIRVMTRLCHVHG